jgi:hypothetical protein
VDLARAPGGGWRAAAPTLVSASRKDAAVQK